jgi:hypothetical protein
MGRRQIEDGLHGTFGSRLVTNLRDDSPAGPMKT